MAIEEDKLGKGEKSERGEVRTGVKKGGARHDFEEQYRNSGPVTVMEAQGPKGRLKADRRMRRGGDPGLPFSNKRSERAATRETKTE